MSSNGTKKDDLHIGMTVAINPQSDKTRKVLVQGVIDEILTNVQEHTHGILVKLGNGQIGRVKDIIPESNNAGTINNATPSQTDDLPISEFIKEGENHFSEFKTSALWSKNLSPNKINESNSKEVKQYGRNASVFIIAKTIAGFLNSDGGTLVIGIKENKDDKSDEIIGVESEFKKLVDPCIDGYRRMILDKIMKPYFPSYIFHHINDYIHIDFESIGEKIVCRIKAFKSDVKVFININNHELFFVRIDASTREIHGSDIVDYCDKRF